MFSKRVRADLALGFCALIWGATFVAVKDALADVSVLVYLAVRFALAAVVMAEKQSGRVRKSVSACSPRMFFRPAG
jgi:drug/metabolite transporter (DMT)-like permease